QRRFDLAPQAVGDLELVPADHHREAIGATPAHHPEQEVAAAAADLHAGARDVADGRADVLLDGLDAAAPLRNGDAADLHAALVAAPRPPSVLRPRVGHDGVHLVGRQGGDDAGLDAAHDLH